MTTSTSPSSALPRAQPISGSTAWPGQPWSWASSAPYSPLCHSSIHALLFSEDAVSLENKLHRALDDRRVNRVNLRREFFRATPQEVLQVLKGIDLNQHLFEYAEGPEAQVAHKRKA